jgi:hypothetical protein
MNIRQERTETEDTRGEGRREKSGNVTREKTKKREGRRETGEEDEQWEREDKK